LNQFQSFIKRLKRGEDQAFKDLVFSYSSLLMTTAKLYCYQSRQAEDILQDSFIVVFQKVNHFTGENEATLIGWMKKIVINKAFNANKKLSSSQELTVETYDTDIVIDADGLSNLSYDEVMQLVLNLPDGYRQVFALNVLEGYNHNEIGEKLGISASSSRSQLNRAKKKLQLKINSLSNIEIS